MKSSIYFFLTFLLFTSCSSENTTTSKSSTAPNLSLVCQKETSKMEGIPAHSVHLVFNDKKIKLADIQSCETFPKEDFANYDIPKNAMQAIGGWWAGAGEYFYLHKKSDDSYIVKYGQMYEEKETKLYDYTELIRIKKNEAGEFIAIPKHELKSLVGVYTLGGHDNSWLLKVNAKGDGLEATYYALNEMLPPASFLKENKIPAEGKVLSNFDIDFSDMVIESDLGTGQLETIFGRERITFFNIKSHQEDMLRLTKDEAYGFLVE